MAAGGLHLNWGIPFKRDMELVRKILIISWTAAQPGMQAVRIVSLGRASSPYIKLSSANAVAYAVMNLFWISGNASFAMMISWIAKAPRD